MCQTIRFRFAKHNVYLFQGLLICCFVFLLFGLKQENAYMLDFFSSLVFCLCFSAKQQKKFSDIRCMKCSNSWEIANAHEFITFKMNVGRVRD